MSNGNKSLKNFFNSNKFIGSFQSYKDIKKIKTINDCCFVGRSNVGKSSMINAVTKTKNLAKTSKTPGRTQSINIFMINENINLVDLPGYGYAKVSKVMRDNLGILIEEYIMNQLNLIHAYVLIDAKVDENKKVSEWNDSEIASIRDVVGKIMIEGELRSETQLNIKRLMDIGSNRGIRHRLGLPLRGQRTKNNSRTRKGKRKTVANKKKVTK